MSDGDAEADALARLEAALDRIALRMQAPAAPPAYQAPVADTGAVAARLDRLIAQLRDALDTAQSGDPALSEA